MFVFQMWEGTFLLGNVTHIPGSPSPECQTGLLQQGLTHPWHPHDTRCPVPPGTQCSVSPGDKPLPLATGSYCSAHKVSVTVRSAEQINPLHVGYGCVEVGLWGRQGQGVPAEPWIPGWRQRQQPGGRPGAPVWEVVALGAPGEG